MSGVNQMSILKNSKDLLEYMLSRSLFTYNIIKTFDFSILYTTTPPLKAKRQIKRIGPTVFL